MKLLLALLFTFLLSIPYSNAQDGNETSMIMFAYNVDNNYKKTDMGYLIEHGYDDEEVIKERLYKRVKDKFKANKIGGLGTDSASNLVNNYFYGPYLVIIKVNGEKPELQTRSIGLIHGGGFGKTRDEALKNAVSHLRRRAGISALEKLDFYTVVEEKVFHAE